MKIPVCFISVWAASLASAAALASDAPAPARGALSLTPCQIEHPTRVSVAAAECGTLSVPENRSAPDGRQISLHIARVPAISQRKEPDPLFLLAGGPGSAASDLYAQASTVFARIRRDRDIVLVDQRGTGRSNPLSCELDETALLNATDAVVESVSRRCLAVLEDRADVSQYTTSVAVRDLDDVRAALGYERINLYGSSYGTRVAQHYARRFPERTRTVILDGVVAPEIALGPDIALGAERALIRIFERCTEDPACKERFGDPAESYHALRTMLARRPVEVQLADPTTGEPTRVELGPMELAVVLRLSSYTSEQAALLPLALHLAHRQGNYTALASQFLLITRRMGEQLAYGMHNTVVCTEDVPFFQADRIDREQLAGTFIGTVQVDALLNVCKFWPRGPVDDDLHEPLRSTVPALLLSGGNDPVTPPAYAEQASRGFERHAHVVVPDLGHGLLTAPCVDRIMAAFIRRGTPEGLDVTCTQHIRPMPFFVSAAGPTP